MTVTTAPKGIESIAKKYGIDGAKLAARMQNLSKLKSKEGLIVDTDIGYMRLIVQMSEEDWGVELSEEEKRYVSLGHQRLFPKEVMNRIARTEGRGRANLDKLSYTFEEGRFVPVTTWKEWKAENDRLKKEFFEIRNEVIKDYDKTVAEVKKDLAERAEKVFNRMKTSPILNVEGKPTPLPETMQDPEEWKRNFVKRLAAKIPSKEAFRDSFYWTEKYKYLRMPSEIEEELLQQETVRAERAQLYHQEEDRKAKVEAMNDDFVVQLRAEKEKAAAEQDKFISEAMKSQREAITACLGQALDTVARNGGKMAGSTIKALKGMVDRARSLNFFDDAEVNESIGKLDHWLGKDARSRSVPLFKRQARDIKAMMDDSIRKLEDEDTRQEEVCRIVGSDLMKSVRTVE
jgi:hypothetical protein